MTIMMPERKTPAGTTTQVKSQEACLEITGSVDGSAKRIHRLQTNIQHFQARRGTY